MKYEVGDELELAGAVFGDDIDIGVFMTEMMRLLGTKLTASQASAVLQEVALRNGRKTVIERWRRNGELFTVDSFPEGFAEAVEREYRVSLARIVGEVASDRGCDKSVSGAFIRHCGTVYFNAMGRDTILVSLMSRNINRWEKVQTYLE